HRPQKSSTGDDQQQPQDRGKGRRPSGIATAPTPGSFKGAGPTSPDGQAGQKSIQIFGQKFGGGITVARLFAPTLPATGHQIARQPRARLAGKGGFHGLHFAQNLKGGRAAESASTCQQLE